MDNREELYTSINSLIGKLQLLFSKDYNVTVLPPHNNDQRNEHSTLYNSSYNNYIFYGDTIVHNKCKKENIKNSSEDDSTNKVLGTVIVASATVAATWVFSKDGYVKLLRSGVSRDLQNIKDKSTSFLLNSNALESYREIDKAIEQCSRWLQKYTNRTRWNFLNKVGLFVSTLILGVGVFFSSPIVVSTACLGGLGSGCYMLWNKLDEVGEHSKLEEIGLYNNSLYSLYQISGNLQNSYNVNENMYASAPSM
ncbi:Transmembrane domain-containing protein [Orpheovirus IHUMI-LCC2]|uniref:Transmembrane domain-containing protein n=1 Tax=Orpheovirus IHUMI-LCC2 TaxID=2023057 RepID=A0A2I2L5J9_9VIRU|nr:Transmembrane domain-containing protein [Orpheovirus IHUMI-LCC2]SNW62796.1 Transmembrane domain-containing protein [Orpheovirus IHUMI-LCC2]